MSDKQPKVNEVDPRNRRKLPLVFSKYNVIKIWINKSVNWEFKITIKQCFVNKKELFTKKNN